MSSDLTKLQAAIKKSKVPERLEKDNLLLLTWNIAHLLEKTVRSIKYMAEREDLTL